MVKKHQSTLKIIFGNIQLSRISVLDKILVEGAPSDASVGKNRSEKMYVCVLNILYVNIFLDKA